MTRSHRAALVAFAMVAMVFAPFAGLHDASATDTVRDGALLYAEPEWDSPVLATLSGSQTVTLNGAPSESFYPVIVDGQQGWVNGTNLAVDKSTEATALPPAPTTSEAAATIPSDQSSSATDGAPDAGTSQPNQPHAFEEPTATPNPATDQAPPGAVIEPGPGSAPPVSTNGAGESVIAAPPAASLAPDPNQAAATTPESDAGASADQGAPTSGDGANETSGLVEPIPAESTPAEETLADPPPAPDATIDTTATADPVTETNEPATTPVASPAVPATEPAPDPAASEPLPTAIPATVVATSTPEPAATFAPLVDPVTDETEATTGSPASSPAPSSTPEPESTPEPTPEPVLQPWGLATAKWDSPLRDWSSDDAGLVFMVPAGSTVELLGETRGRWVKTNYMWMYGWMDFGSLEPPAPVADEQIPASVDEEDVKTPKAGAGEAWTTVDLSLRAGPSATEDVLDSVPAGTRIDLTGVMENGFQRVTFRGKVGWISNEYLSLPSDPKPGQTSNNAKKNYSEQQVLGYIADAAKKYGQSKSDMERVARCESNLDPYAVNPSGSYGLFQFVRSTWESTPFGDKDIFDPKWNALAAGWMWEQGRKSEWVCQ